MTSGFRDLVQDVSSQIRREGDDTRALIQSLEDRRQHSQFSRDVLDSLRFDTINARQENIADSFGDTFKWVFDRSQEATGPWTNFAKWSETDDGIYWINGKAGSGKSTVSEYTNFDTRISEWINLVMSSIVFDDNPLWCRFIECNNILTACQIC